MSVLKYTLLRLGAFCLVFAAALLMGAGYLLSAVAGLLVAWAVAYLFFNRLRLEAGAQLAGWLGRRRTSAGEQADNEAEDALAEEFHQKQGPADDADAQPR